MFHVPLFRKMNDLIKRTRNVKVNAIILSYLRRQMPAIGRNGKKKELIKHLDKHFEIIQVNLYILRIWIIN